MVAWIVGLVAVAGGLAACAAPGTTGAPGPGASVATSESPSPGPTWVLALPGTGKPAADQPDRTVTGTIIVGADGKCLVLRTTAGEQYQLLNGDPAVVYAGARLAVTGHPATGISTTCMQGVPFTVTTAETAK